MMAQQVRIQGSPSLVQMQDDCEIIWFFDSLANPREHNDSKSVWISRTVAKLHLYKSLTTVQKVNERGPDE
jgi:hypothetical protein